MVLRVRLLRIRPNQVVLSSERHAIEDQNTVPNQVFKADFVDDNDNMGVHMKLRINVCTDVSNMYHYLKIMLIVKYDKNSLKSDEEFQVDQ